MQKDHLKCPVTPEELQDKWLAQTDQIVSTKFLEDCRETLKRFLERIPVTNKNNPFRDFVFRQAMLGIILVR